MEAETAEVVETEVTKIFEACSFQDITGQRITKVVSTLKQIDEKVSDLLGVLAKKMPGYEEVTEEGDSNGQSDSGLVNGPQLPQNAITQDDIDKLLSDFDN